MEKNTMIAILKTGFVILLEDVGRTHNINCHTFDCLAISEEEAIGKMVRQRPDLRPDKIISVTQINAN
jgi:hypothetical protein